jgi:UDP-N-acetylglucosamine acyltransferase
VADVHPTAIVEPGAVLGDGVSVGPYCTIGGKVELGDDVRLESHVVIAGRTSIGSGTRVYPFAVIGHAPQDLKYRGEDSRLIIGQRNVIREHVTMNPGTKGGGMATVVGDDGLFMVGAHVAHDCRVGDHVIMANNATLGGHVQIGDHAVLGGLSAVHQFVRIGAHAMIGGMSGVEHDVVPYALVMGDRARLSGPNLVGLRRRGFTRAEIEDLRQALRLLFELDGTIRDRLDRISGQFGDSRTVKELVAFVAADSSRALCRPRSHDA